MNSSLRHSRGVQLTKTRVPIGGRMLEIHHVRDIDRLMDNMTVEEIADEKMPYYGNLWHSAVGLGRWVWRAGDLSGQEILDLGCGVGLTGIAAAMRGAKVVFADYFPEALEIAKRNTIVNRLPGHEFLTVDWRDPRFARRFDRILASDVLYEKRNHEPILDFLLRCLKPQGVASIADPQRPNSRPFFELAAEEFTIAKEEILVDQRKIQLPVEVFSLRRKEG